jgi:hypothetical protein
MHERFSSLLAIGAGLLMQVVAIAKPVPRGQAEVTATSFYRTILGPSGFSYWEFEGKARQRMKPLLSKRLLVHLDNLHTCFRDWASHQSPNSTDKPPGVDCCVFSASADWSPTSFALQESNASPDGRRRVTIEYRFDSAHEHARWHVAVYIVKEGQRFVVDDFEGGLDDPKSDRWFEVRDDSQCKQGKWVSPY